MKKMWLLVILSVLPALLALLGLRETESDFWKLLLINPYLMGLLGAVVALILQHRRSIWLAVVVCFFFSYFAIGLVGGTFFTAGVFDRETINTSALLSVGGMFGAFVSHFLSNLLRKMFESLNK